MILQAGAGEITQPTHCASSRLVPCDVKLLGCAIKQFVDLLIRNLREVVVELPNAVEWLRHRQADQVVYFKPQMITGGSRRHWHSYYDPSRVHLAQGINRSAHA